MAEIPTSTRLNECPRKIAQSGACSIHDTPDPIAQRTYLHVSYLDLIDATTRDKVNEAFVRAGVRPEEHFNIVRLDPRFTRISLLHYPNFFDAPFPELRESWSVDLEAGQTIPHLHVGFISRYAGDDPDPRGGVRPIFPKKAKYWT